MIKHTYYFKLVRTIFVHKGNGYAHKTIIVTRDVNHFVYVYGIEIVIMRMDFR